MNRIATTDRNRDPRGLPANSQPADPALMRRIETLMNDYVHCIDDDRLEEWPDFFTDDCLYQIISRDNHARGLPLGVVYCDSKGMLVDRIAALRRANIYEAHVYCHMISAIQYLGEHGGVHRVKSNYMVVRTMQTGETLLFSTGRYLDCIVEQERRLKFVERTVLFDSKRVDTLLVIPI